MAKRPFRYAKFDTGGFTLRDELAIDRTLLANERTFLAYLRSGMALLIAGVTIIHFATSGWFRAVGLACLPIGVAAGLIGLVRTRRLGRGLTALIRRTGTETGTDPKD
ncbi:MAG: DUF202 domain-containing protein [Candidatus Aminicenantes bacterium]|nr:DUF202 domain-containing protein [Candidatus Aminicenantes bacterium]